MIQVQTSPARLGPQPASAMPDRACAGRMGDGRLWLRHGPIELQLDLGGCADQQARGERAALEAFDGLLEALVAELPLLRAPLGAVAPSGPVARRMAAAVRPHSPRFITPMAAVAGAVADHLCQTIREHGRLERIVVNNGGDIALWLGRGQAYRFGIADPTAPRRLLARMEVTASDGIGGVATSGWRGRSHSLGIADAVTVLADSSAMADAAATIIANDVDLPGSERIARQPANELAPDSDLGARLVTVGVRTLAPRDVAHALDRGVRTACHVMTSGCARAVFLSLQGQTRSLGRTSMDTTTQGRLR